MADAILMAGGKEGVTSDDVTAGKSQVLQGYRTVTTDSDDEVVEGTIKSINTADDNYNINKSNAFGIDESGRMWIDMPHGNGYYHRYDNKPHTCIDSAKLGDATADKVLRGCTFTSKTGVKAEGEMVNRGNGMDAIEFYNANWEGKFVARMEEGYYSKTGQWKPYVAIPYAVLANVVGVDANKMLDTLTIAGKKGQIKSINTQDNNYRVNKSMAFGIDNWSDRNNPVFWIDFPHGNGYYHRADNHPHTCINAVNLGTAGADSILQGQTATSVHGVKFEGAIPRWICNTGDVITALGGEGFAWDDIHANRGRGIVTKIPNGHFIQGANWVFLPSPNLQPWNIRQNVNVNGITGTMVDYGAGGQAFRAATFDGRLLTGVANKGFILNGIERYQALKSPYIGYGYQGVTDGGLKFINGYTGKTNTKSAQDVGCVFANSINLSPFKHLKVGFKVFSFEGDGTESQTARIELEIGVTPVSSAGRESYHSDSGALVRDLGQRSKYATHAMRSTRVMAGNQTDMSQQYLTLDISASSGHHFIYIMLGNIVHEYSAGGVYAVVVVNNIEFIN